LTIELERGIIFWKEQKHTYHFAAAPSKIMIKDKINMIDGIIFDMDGTIWDSTDNVAVAFRKVIEEQYPYVTDEITGEKLKGLFGLPLDEIAVRLFLSVKDRDQAVKIMDDCCRYECEYLAVHGANLYGGVEATLKKLSEKYKLFIVSNCQEGYIQCFFTANPHLEKYFTDYEYPGRTGRFKTDNIKLVVERNHLKHPVYVGDTQGDADASKAAGVPFVFARYGFGDVKDYKSAVDSFAELADKLK
jgi:phosphoglycolate phosphatase